MEKSEIKFTLARLEKCRRHELEAMQEAKALFNEVKEKFYNLFNDMTYDINLNKTRTLFYIHTLDSSGNDMCIFPISFRINSNGDMSFEAIPYDSECAMKISRIVEFGSTYDYINMANILMEKIDKLYGEKYN